MWMRYARSVAAECGGAPAIPHEEELEESGDGGLDEARDDQSQRLVDLISVDLLQKVQDNFSAAVGVAMVIVDEHGEPVTRPSGFSAFCKSVRVIETFRDDCFRCDDLGGRKALATGQPAIYRCHCGLVDFAAPILMRGRYLGAVISGQVTLKRTDGLSELEDVLPQDDRWRQNPILVALREDINQVSYEKLRSAAYTLFYLSAYLVEESYANAVAQELWTKNLRLMEESKKRVELEKSLQEAELQALSCQVNPHFLFNVLNTIGRLALLEGAGRTEQTVHAFAEMMRYVLKKSGSQIVSLGSELTHVRNYLYIQKLRMGDRLSFDIDVPDSYAEVFCPFMGLHPLVENSVQYAVEPCESDGRITITATDDGTDLIIEIADNGEGIDRTLVTRALAGQADHHGRVSIGLHNVDTRLRHFFGDDHGLAIESPTAEGRGTRVRFRLPLRFDPYGA